MNQTGKKTLFWKFASGEPLWMSTKKRAYRDEYLTLGCGERAMHWAANHKAALAALLLVLAVTLSIATTPDDAEALPILVPIIGIGAAIVGGISALDFAIDGVVSWIPDMIRGFCNATFGLAETMLNSCIDSNMLGNEFRYMFGINNGGSTIYDWLHRIQEQFIIPIAMLVLVVFFAIGLCKVVGDAGKQDSGIDTWQLIVTFFAFMLTSVVIENSWSIMAWCYNLAATVIASIGNDIETVASLQTVPDSVENAGVLLSLALASIIVVILAFFVMLITQASIIVRGFQIYIYTALAPIPLATLTSDSGRVIATGFLKRWLATIIAGLVMILLLGCFSQIIHGMGSMAIPPMDDAITAEGTINWTANLLGCFPLYIALAFCMLQSGSWARELMGV